MATSGSVNFTQTRNEIIQDALALVGAYGVGRTISSEDIVFTNNLLNKMIKAWQARGLHLWAEEDAYLFVADNTGRYVLSNATSSARAAYETDTVITQLNGGFAATDTALTVDTTTGMSTSDIIGIVLDSDVVHWTTISTIPSSTTLTIASGLATAAADNSHVYTFTSRINRPLKIHSVRKVTGIDTGSTSTQTATALTQLSHTDFMELPSRNTNGSPTHYYYNPDLDSGSLYLYPRPDDPDMYFSFSFSRMLEDFDASTDNADFPSEWLETITYQLAVRLATAFGKDAKLQSLMPMASAMYEMMLDNDAETGSVYLSPDKGY